MVFYSSKRDGCNVYVTDHGPAPFTASVMGAAQKNQNFRTAFWAGNCLQMTLMNIPACGEIGLEMHLDIDQFIRVESGRALVRMGTCKETLDFQHCLKTGDGVLCRREYGTILAVWSY